MTLTPAGLDEVLARGQAIGFLGPGPVGRHVDHARVLLDGLPERGRVLDLGSGGGVPGLVLAVSRPALHVTLLEARARACRFLRQAVAELGLAAVAVVEARAEEAARRDGLREVFDAVVARSFGPPAVTAECAVGFLRPAGRLVVSEPPLDDDDRAAVRWPADGLATLGLGPAVRGGGPDAAFVTMQKIGGDDRWPRRVGMPAKRPLWRG